MIEFGEIYHSEIKDGVETTYSVKFRDSMPAFSEKVYKQRIKVQRVSDLDFVIEQMHFTHAMHDSYGAWVEKTPNGNVYVVKYWVERNVK